MEEAMQADVGDQIHIKSHQVGVHEQVGEIIEVRGPEGGPPYLVRFTGGRESLVYPGPDAVIEARPAPGD
jgi:hypothetical protein